MRSREKARLQALWMAYDNATAGADALLNPHSHHTALSVAR
uniref:Uncharacterized protein n=1 Tax=Sphingomonas sp. NS2 TaxID=908605 RepID=A0A0D4ZY82_9SPHN|nr:hypothetical protein plasmid201_019 [Sphingomonas sp. NS2]